MTSMGESHRVDNFAYFPKFANTDNEWAVEFDGVNNVRMFVSQMYAVHGCDRQAVLHHCVRLVLIVIGLSLNIALVILGLIEIVCAIGKVVQL